MSKSVLPLFFSTEPVQRAEAQWSMAELGDIRRTRRAVRLGAAIAAQSAASLPKQTQQWSDLKAAYRLLNQGVGVWDSFSGIGPKTPSARAGFPWAIPGHARYVSRQ